jgi:hypothetical protein
VLRGTALIVHGALLLLALPGSIAAQNDPLQAALAPDPALCTLDARTIDDVARLVEASAALPPAASPTPAPAPFVMPDGFSLLEDEREEVEQDLIRAVACFNTGDPLKVFATYTDRYVVELVNRLGGLSNETVAGLTTVRPLEPEDYTQIISIEEAMLLHDGRVLAIVIGDDLADSDPPGARAFYLEEVLPGRWLVDEVIEIVLD